MRRTFFRAALLLVIANFSLPGQARLPQGSSIVATLGIYVDFEVEPSEQAIEVMERETASILKPAGLRIEWRVLAENDGTESFNEIAVIEFGGECDADASWLPPRCNLPLGEAQISEGRVLPFGRIECDQVRRTIQSQLAVAPPERRQILLGRALGRVLAHELYHIVARSTKHSASGVTKPYYGSDELTAETLVLRDRDIDAMRLSMWPGPSARDNPKGGTGTVAVDGRISSFQKRKP
jgi:hypothetical protein